MTAQTLRLSVPVVDGEAAYLDHAEDDAPHLGHAGSNLGHVGSDAAQLGHAGSGAGQLGHADGEAGYLGCAEDACLGRAEGEGAYTVRTGGRRGVRVTPRAVAPGLVALVEQIQRVPWPQWTDAGPRAYREVAELCRLQAARGLTVLSWLADGGGAPGDGDWLLTTQCMTGSHQRRMFDAAAGLADPVRDLVVANWTWALSSPHGVRVAAPFFASGAYPDDGYAAAHATMTLVRLWERAPDVRQALAAAWAATRTPADWCRAADHRVRYGDEVPIFTFPRGPAPPGDVTWPWINRLLGCV
jgi:hypothetical protein